MERRTVAVTALVLVAAMDAAFVWLALQPFPRDFAIESVAVVGLALLAASCWRLGDRSSQRLFVIGWALTAIIAALRIILGLQSAQSPALLTLILYNSGFVAGAAFAAGAYVDREGLEAYEKARFGPALAAAGLLLGLISQYRFMAQTEFVTVAVKMLLLAAAAWALDTRRWRQAASGETD